MSFGDENAPVFDISAYTQPYRVAPLELPNFNGSAVHFVYDVRYVEDCARPEELSLAKLVNANGRAVDLKLNGDWRCDGVTYPNDKVERATLPLGVDLALLRQVEQLVDNPINQSVKTQEKNDGN